MGVCCRQDQLIEFLACSLYLDACTISTRIVLLETDMRLGTWIMLLKTEMRLETCILLLKTDETILPRNLKRGKGLYGG